MRRQPGLGRQIRGSRGRTARALAFYKRGCERAPASDTLLESLARLAASIGLHTEAADDYDRLARRQPANAHWKQAAEAQRNAPR